MLVPTQSLPGLESLFHLVLRLNRSERRLEGTRQEGGAVVIGQDKRLFLGQIKFATRGVVAHVTAGRLAAEPLAHVALGCVGALRQFRRGLVSAGRQSFVQTELVADANQRGVKGRAKINNSLA